jgi:membrane protein YqaA with SNARE-associated domain
MLAHQIITAVAPTVAHRLNHWLYQLGGLGFIPLGLLDNSIMPLPGSMDVLIIVLSARSGQLWLYYALMATLGSVIGGYVTYRLARKGGKAALEDRFPKKKLGKVYKIFERWGFWAILFPALLPPPVPTTAFLFAAGALQYPVKKFLAALAMGRAIRYTLLAFLADLYGRQVLAFFKVHGHPVLLAIVGLVAAAVLVILYYAMGRKQKKVKAKA